MAEKRYPANTSNNPGAAYKARDLQYDAKNDPKSKDKARTAARAKGIANRIKSVEKARVTTEQAAATKAAIAARKPATNIVDSITKRFRVTQREARDIVTAVSSAAGLALDKNTGAGRKSEVGKAVKNIGKQIKETGVAAKTGKRGTTGGFKGTNVGEYPYIFVKGKSRP